MKESNANQVFALTIFKENQNQGFLLFINEGDSENFLQYCKVGASHGSSGCHYEKLGMVQANDFYRTMVNNRKSFFVASLDMIV